MNDGVGGVARTKIIRNRNQYVGDTRRGYRTRNRGHGVAIDIAGDHEAGVGWAVQIGIQESQIDVGGCGGLDKLHSRTRLGAQRPFVHAIWKITKYYPHRPRSREAVHPQRVGGGGGAHLGAGSIESPYRDTPRAVFAGALLAVAVVVVKNFS
jgi:hypothetical protein